MTDDIVEPICRCGTERIVAGKAIICPHCDQGCPGCTHCDVLRRVCTDCRKFYLTETARSQCERGHYR